jgi:predicted dienelactone hydrolase
MTMVKTRVRTVGLWLLLALVLSACQPNQAPAAVQATLIPAPTAAQATLVPVPAAAQATSVPVPAAAQAAPQGARPDAPTYAARGPFAVGYKPLVIGAGTERPLEGSLWYPALNPTGRKEEVTYEIKMKGSAWTTDLPTVVYGHALLNADIDGSKGPYPLVVWSHGFSASAAMNSNLLEHYASYGFIVLAPEHTEQLNNSDFSAVPMAWSDLWTSSIDRPLDIKQTLDDAEKLTAPGGDMAGLIDMQHVAVVGHSSGGYTALAMAGAQYDLEAFNARCAQLPADDPNTFLCTSHVPKEADMAARAGFDPMPQGLWPSLGDPRVTAIIPMASDSYLFDTAGLAKITIPMMAMGGTADTGTPYLWGVKPAYDYASSPQKALVSFVGGEHLIFGTPCANQPWIVKLPAYGFFCFDPVWDKTRVLDLIDHFSTAFLLDTLKGDKAAHAALLPDAITFPGIEYTTTMQ